MLVLVLSELKVGEEKHVEPVGVFTLELVKVGLRLLHLFLRVHRGNL